MARPVRVTLRSDIDHPYLQNLSRLPRFLQSTYPNIISMRRIKVIGWPWADIERNRLRGCYAVAGSEVLPFERGCFRASPRA
jgi:hypothetical protein